MLNRLVPPPFKTIEKIPLLQAQSQPLTNGIKLHWLHAGEQPVIRIEFIFKAGTWYEPQDAISYFTTKMLNEGTKNYTARQLNEYFDQFGSFLEFNNGMDKVSITVYAVTKHLSKLLPVLKEIISESVFPQAELDNLKNITIQNLKVNTEKTSYLAQTRFKELLFGSQHPYGKNLYEIAILNVEAENLKKFYNSHIKSQPFDIILAGNIEENTLAAIRNTFEDVSFSESPEQKPSVAISTSTERTEVVEKPESLQSSIRLGREMFTRHHPDYFGMLVLNEILGGYFGSRLMKNIREDKGFTYGISSNLVTQRQSGYLVIGTDVKKEFTTQTIEEIYKEMQVLQQEPVGEEELETVKNYMIGSFAGSITTPFELADRFKTIYFDGLSYDFYERYLDSIKSTTAEDLLSLATKYLQAEKMLEVVAGGKG